MKRARYDEIDYPEYQLLRRLSRGPIGLAGAETIVSKLAAGQQQPTPRLERLRECGLIYMSVQITPAGREMLSELMQEQQTK